MATKQQIPVLAGAIVSKQESFAALPDKDAQWAIENTDEAIRLAVEAIQNRGGFIKRRSKMPIEIDEQLKLWQEFYELYFGLEDVKTIDPERPNPSVRFKQLVVVAKGITLNDVLKAMRTKMKVWSYTEDLNSAVPTNERSADKGHYAIYVRDTIEADEELRNTSVNEIAKKKTATMTLLERMLLELFIFHWTGEHLDVKNVTLCAGSRDSDGDVPGVDWCDNEVRISWCRTDDSGDDLRARAVQFVG